VGAQNHSTKGGELAFRRFCRCALPPEVMASKGVKKEKKTPPPSLAQVEDIVRRHQSASDGRIASLERAVQELQHALTSTRDDLSFALRAIDDIRRDNHGLREHLELSQQREAELQRKVEVQEQIRAREERDREEARARQQRAMPLRGISNWMSGYPSLEKFAERSNDFIQLHHLQNSQEGVDEETLRMALLRDRPVVAVFIHNSSRIDMDADKPLALVRSLADRAPEVEFALLLMKMGENQPASPASVKELAQKSGIDSKKIHVFAINYRQKDFVKLDELEKLTHLLKAPVGSGCACCT
jgi:hypothetical protein